MKLARFPPAQHGMTLVELVVSIVVISVGLAGILVVMDRTTATSGDPLVQHQALAVAEAYLEEILAKPFCDPDSPGSCTPPNAPASAGCQVCPAPEGSRVLFDNVCDYNGLIENPPRNQSDTPINPLSAYTASVAVLVDDVLGPGGDELNGGACEVLMVRVTVAGPAGTNIVLVGHRTNY